MASSTESNARKVYKIASIPADGIGPEVISAGIQVLEKLAATVGTFDFHFDHIEWSSEYYKKHGYYIPEGGLESLKKYNAILFGSVGAPGKPTNEPAVAIFSSAALVHYILASNQIFQLISTVHRCTRPHLALGPTPRYLPAFPTVRQRAPYEGAARHLLAPQELPSRLPRLGNCSRKQRRRVRRPRGPHPCRSSLGSGHRSLNIHTARDRQIDAVCI